MHSRNNTWYSKIRSPYKRETDELIRTKNNIYIYAIRRKINYLKINTFSNWYITMPIAYLNNKEQIYNEIGNFFNHLKSIHLQTFDNALLQDAIHLPYNILLKQNTTSKTLNHISNSYKRIN